MPPKKFQKKVLPVDWEWAGTEIKKPEDITPQHRLRAAGLVGVTPCHFHPILRPSDDDIKPLGDSNCNEKRCKSWPTCYNHIGAEEVSEGRKEERKELMEGSRATCEAEVFRPGAWRPSSRARWTCGPTQCRSYLFCELHIISRC